MALNNLKGGYSIKEPTNQPTKQTNKILVAYLSSTCHLKPLLKILKSCVSFLTLTVRVHAVIFVVGHTDGGLIHWYKWEGGYFITILLLDKSKVLNEST